MDWTIFHALNGALRTGDGGQDAAVAFNAAAVFVLVALAGLLWFVARPGGSLRPKLAALSAASSVLLALLGNIVLGHLWYHPRPFVAHPRLTVLLVHHAPDNSFPSEHASVAFATAFAVFAFYRRLGALLIAGAVGIAVDRVFVGVHYPVDVAASLVVGLCSAAVVTTVGRTPIRFAVERLSRLSDPLVAPVWDSFGRHA